MPAAQREFPYIWATWLPRLLTGERACEWAIWFKARHQGWNRKPSDFNQADWLARHTALLNEHRDRWIQSCYDVLVENQNAFQLRGHSAILASKPDLLVLNKDRILIIDFKTGQAQPWHKFQVMTYMVRPALGYARVPRLQVLRRNRLRQPHRARSLGRHRPELRTQPRLTDPPDRGSGAPGARSQRQRVPLLRHHGRGLPCLRVDGDVEPRQETTLEF